MIFVDGLKFIYGDERGKVDINQLQKADLDKMRCYFESFGYIVDVDIYDTIFEYQFKHPNLFKDKELIRPHHVLHDFYYEIFGEEIVSLEYRLDKRLFFSFATVSYLYKYISKSKFPKLYQVNGSDYD